MKVEEIGGTTRGAEYATAPLPDRTWYQKLIFNSLNPDFLTFSIKYTFQISIQNLLLRKILFILIGITSLKICSNIIYSQNISRSSLPRESSTAYGK